MFDQITKCFIIFSVFSYPKTIIRTKNELYKKIIGEPYILHNIYITILLKI